MYPLSKKVPKPEIGRIPPNCATLSATKLTPAARDFAALLADIAFRKFKAERHKALVEKV